MQFVKYKGVLSIGVFGLSIKTNSRGRLPITIIELDMYKGVLSAESHKVL